MTDIHRIDLPAEFASGEPSGDIVFVHGLEGDARKSWMADPNDDATFWLKWVAREFPGCRVWSLGYDASMTGWVSESMTLADRASNICDRLRQVGIGKHPLVFVAHSLGGLVVKGVLRHAFDSPPGNDCRAICDVTCGVAFLATPHRGAPLASFAKSWLPFARPSNAVRALVYQKPELLRINKWFVDWYSRIFTFAVYCESRRTMGLQVVGPDSADPGLPGVPCVPVDRDHSAICKPLNAQDQVYRGVIEMIRKAFRRPEIERTGREEGLIEATPSVGKADCRRAPKAALWALGGVAVASALVLLHNAPPAGALTGATSDELPIAWQASARYMPPIVEPEESAQEHGSRTAVARSSEHCGSVRAEVQDARRAGKWREMSRLLAERGCWRSRPEFDSLRVLAYMQQEKFAECVRAGRELTDAEDREWVLTCEARLRARSPA